MDIVRDRGLESFCWSELKTADSSEHEVGMDAVKDVVERMSRKEENERRNTSLRAE